MSFLSRLLGKSEPPKQRVQVCVECGMPVADHKQWCSILQGQNEMKQKAEREKKTGRRPGVGWHMIGSDTGPGRVPCRDLPKIPIRCSRFPPNLATAPPVASPSDPATQPVAAPEDARRLQQAPAVDPLIARVDRLERALEDSKKQVSTLKSEVATLVRALGDIKKPMSRPDATPPRATRSGMRTVATAVGLVIGLGFGILAWAYLTARR